MLEPSPVIWIEPRYTPSQDTGGADAGGSLVADFGGEPQPVLAMTAMTAASLLQPTRILTSFHLPGGQLTGGIHASLRARRTLARTILFSFERRIGNILRLRRGGRRGGNTSGDSAAGQA